MTPGMHNQLKTMENKKNSTKLKAELWKEVCSFSVYYYTENEQKKGLYEAHSSTF